MNCWRASTKKYQQPENITPEVEGDAARFVCEFLYRRASEKRAAQGHQGREELGL